MTIWLNWVKNEQPSQCCHLFKEGCTFFCCDLYVIGRFAKKIFFSNSQQLAEWQRLRNWFCEVARSSAGSRRCTIAHQVKKYFIKRGKMLQKKKNGGQNDALKKLMKIGLLSKLAWPKASFDKKSSQPPVETKLLLIFRGSLYRVVPYQQRFV